MSGEVADHVRCFAVRSPAWREAELHVTDMEGKSRLYRFSTGQLELLVADSVRILTQRSLIEMPPA